VSYGVAVGDKQWLVKGATGSEATVWLRRITSDHVTAVLKDTAPARRRSVHPPLRSLFRAL